MFLFNSWAKHCVCHSNDIVPLFLPSWCRLPWYRIIFESGAVFVSTTRTWFSVHPLTIENPTLSPSQFSCNLASYIFVRDRLENGIRKMEYGRIKATLHLSNFHYSPENFLDWKLLLASQNQTSDECPYEEECCLRERDEGITRNRYYGWKIISFKHEKSRRSTNQGYLNSFHLQFS